ncbi:MDR family MFS transporter [Novosphingobium sp. PASSN1]|uniref:MDR family MFS transporter n=1 Tax=Novosphingobium sp. PASSN1 TaxID=2015561 RepID=UPI000BC719CB|nr:MDR family MFS transporter [Novosphingobium sp. PASSN1]OYU34234.1 MAG: MFS transporter [Novosphingobium sp. PASSN1]
MTAAAIPHHFSDSERRIALVAVLIVLFLSALDQTIVATAMPRIVKELAGLDRIAWVGTAYLLTSTVTVPIYGKLGDIFGRRPVLVFGVIVFLTGSMLCGLSGEFGTLALVGDGMNQLIFCRAIQGLGAGALTTGAFATVADIAPPAERGKYTGLFGAMFGLAGLAGPVLGGFLTDHATTTVLGHVVSGWRFVFYVNLPLGLLALYILLTKLPAGRRGADARIDWLGSVLIVASAVPLLLALSWGGQGAGGGWEQPRVLLGFAAALVAFIAFIAVSRGKSWAVVPLDLFADPVVARANLALFLINLGYMGVPMFLPLYLQLVRGLSASQSGFAMLPLLFGVLTGSMIAGRMARKTQQYKPVIVGGGVVALASLAALTLMTPDTPRWVLTLNLLALGIGLGPAQGMFTLAIQSAVSHARTGVATASAQFCRQIGATIGVAIFGALLTWQLSGELKLRVPELASAGQHLELSKAQTLAMDRGALRAALAARGDRDPAVAERAGAALRTSFALSIERLFPVALLILGIAFLVTLAVPARRLRGRADPVPEA